METRFIDFIPFHGYFTALITRQNVFESTAFITIYVNERGAISTSNSTLCKIFSIQNVQENTMIALLLKPELARKDQYLLQKKFPKRQESTQSSRSTKKTCIEKIKIRVIKQPSGLTLEY